MLNLSDDPMDLFNYYDELLKKFDKNLFFIPDNKNNSLYIGFQKHIY